MVKQGKKLTNILRHLKLFRTLLRNFQDFMEIENFTKVALEKL